MPDGTTALGFVARFEAFLAIVSLACGLKLVAPGARSSDDSDPALLTFAALALAVGAADA